MIRRAILKAIAIPGYQVPFASREMPMPQGWGTGGVQVTAAILGPDDVLKVIDQGSDDTTNAVSIRNFFVKTAGVKITTSTADATIVQTRHRIPELPLTESQVLVFQVPIPEPLRFLEPRETETRRMHALEEYGLMHVKLYEDISRHGQISTSYAYPVKVDDRYVMDPSPTPKFDNPKMNDCAALQLFGAGREKRIYAIPPYTQVVSLDFEDHPFEPRWAPGTCALCGATDSFLDEIITDDKGGRMFVCSDTDHCETRRAEAPSGSTPVDSNRERDGTNPLPLKGEGERRRSDGWTMSAIETINDALADTGDDTPLLRAEGLSKWYGRQLGCREVSFDLFPGEVMAVVGESGSGKTTLLQLLSAQLAPCAGSVGYRMRDGVLRDLATLSEAERRFLFRTDWGYVHQDPALGLRMAVSAGANVGERLMAVGWRHYGRIRGAAEEWLDRVEIARTRIDDPPATYSGGMRQRLQIARNLVTHPRLVFLDEPTGGLDVSVQAKLLDLIRGLVAELGLAAVIVTHDLAVARLLSHRVMVMKNGEVIETGLTDQVLDDPHEPYTQLLVSSILPA
jgi:alpha-D-ribose 1-methylphosphonate 5-phosphate C-P lyase